MSTDEFQPWQVENLANGKVAVKNVLEKAYKATEKADMRDALADLKSRMVDWRGYRIDNFGELIAHDSLRGRSDNRAKDTTKTVCDQLKCFLVGFLADNSSLCSIRCTCSRKFSYV